MKKLLIVGILIALLFVTMPAMAQYPVITYHLFAGQNIHVGDVVVGPNGRGLAVEFEMDEGWYVNETHLAVKKYLNDIPQTKNHSPIPGKFEYSMAYEVPASNDKYVIPMPESSVVMMAFQADVVHAGIGAEVGIQKEIVYDQEEGAWAACEGIGTHTFNNKNWATYFYYPKEPS
jgi:hypothetical protein